MEGKYKITFQSSGYLDGYHLVAKIEMCVNL